MSKGMIYFTFGIAILCGLVGAPEYVFILAGVGLVAGVLYVLLRYPTLLAIAVVALLILAAVAAL